jgi:hypothetical protein
MLASVWRFIARFWGSVTDTSDGPAAPRQAPTPFRGHSRPRRSRVSLPGAPRIGAAKSARVSGPKPLRIALHDKRPVADRKLRATPHPTPLQVSPRRSAPSRHVWLEARAPAGRIASAAIIPLAPRTVRSVAEPTSIVTAA